MCLSGPAVNTSLYHCALPWRNPAGGFAGKSSKSAEDSPERHIQTCRVYYIVVPE